MLETKFGSCCVILGLKCVFERADRTHIAVAIQQRVANRTRSSVCRFHNPWLGFLPTASSANSRPSLHWTSLAGNLGLQFDRDACLRVFNPLALARLTVSRSTDPAGEVPTTDPVGKRKAYRRPMSCACLKAKLISCCVSLRPSLDSRYSIRLRSSGVRLANSGR
jgi:hypothetical protein